MSKSGCSIEVDGPFKQPCANPEQWLKLRLDASEIKVYRLPPFQWVVCGPGPKSGLATHDLKWYSSHGLKCHKDNLPFRYAEEYHMARVVSECLHEKHVDNTGWLDGRRFTGDFDRILLATQECWCAATK